MLTFDACCTTEYIERGRHVIRKALSSEADLFEELPFQYLVYITHNFETKLEEGAFCQFEGKDADANLVVAINTYSVDLRRDIEVMNGIDFTISRVAEHGTWLH